MMVVQTVQITGRRQNLTIIKIDVNPRKDIKVVPDADSALKACSVGNEIDDVRHPSSAKSYHGDCPRLHRPELSAPRA